MPEAPVQISPDSPPVVDGRGVDQITIIDSSVAEHERLIHTINTDTTLYILDSNEDGVEQIINLIKDHGRITAMHIIAHGSDGGIQLGSTRLDLDNIEQYSHQIGSIAHKLNDGADLLLYSCDLAASTRGENFLSALANLTGADIAASRNKTGSQRLGGDWDLEFKYGPVETAAHWSSEKAPQYPYLLAVPKIISDGGGSFARKDVTENQTFVTDVDATDTDGDTLTYSISGGADARLFSIDPASGVLTYKEAPNFEKPTDTGADNLYVVQVKVTDNSAGSFSDLQIIIVRVINVNEPPEITSDGGGDFASVNVAENQTAVTTVTATDPDLSDTLSYSITGGADQGKFKIGSKSGVLTFRKPPNYSSPTDEGADNIYNVQVTVTDNGAGNLSDMQAIAVTVSNLNEAPVITSNGGGDLASVDVVENQMAVTTVTATDPDIADMLTYSLTGGADQSQFSINKGSGVLTFKVPPNFENPNDAGADNIYDVQVTVTDNGAGSLTDSQTIRVTVINLNEAPLITSDGGGSNASISAPENEAFVTDVDGTDTDGDTLTYSISGGVDASLFSIDHASGVLTFEVPADYENPNDAGANNVYDIEVTVTDDGADHLTDVQTIMVTVINVNEAPEITSNGGGDFASVIAAESQLAVTTVTAADPDVEDTHTFSISGGADAANFIINGSSGVLTFTKMPDFENPLDVDTNNSYEVWVTVTDSGPKPLSDEQRLEVTVVDKGPKITAPADISTDATGLFTPVSLGEATVVDSHTTFNDGTGYFAPGRHIVTWTAIDEGGETDQATQTVIVRPLAEFALNKQVVENDQVEVNLVAYLNGDAATYPVEIPYQVSGTATEGVDHDLTAGTITIASGREGSVPFTVLDDGVVGESDETIIVRMDADNLKNAVPGNLSEQIFTIREDNVAPEVSLIAFQGNTLTTTITQDGGSVTLFAIVNDPNVNDIHSFNWGQTDNQLIDSDTDEATFTIDPNLLGTLDSGVYVVRLTVGDGALSGMATLPLRVIETAPHLLPAADHDGDGIGDAAEGIGDVDNDGIPDYLDSIDSPNVLQSQEAVDSLYLIETQAGLHISLGSMALLSRDYQAEIDTDQLTLNGITPDSAADYHNGIFDFRITGLPLAGQSALVVIPQMAAIPENGIYRKWSPTSGWSDFLIDARNAVYSAAGSIGYCPSVGDAEYTEGLTAGHWCVQLLIEDGGANDADNMANREISDPGGIGNTFKGTASVSGGGGSLSPLLVLLLGLLVLGRYMNDMELMPAKINHECRRQNMSIVFNWLLSALKLI